MIRTAKKEDVDSVYTLMCELEEKELNQIVFKEIFFDQLECGYWNILVYELDGAIQGFLNFRTEFQIHHCAKIAEIMELYVKDTFRDIGIGSMLFEAACKEAKEDGCTQVEVCSNKTRTNAHRFYEKKGFLKSHYKFTKPL